MFDRTSPYFRQVELLVRALPAIAAEPDFALKGGTAINLFVQNMPRLSVDIDLVYLPKTPRTEAFEAMTDGLERMADRLQGAIKGAAVNRQLDPDRGQFKLQLSSGGVQIKIEVSPVLRGTVLAPKTMNVTAAVEDMFGFAEIPLLTPDELYAGKLVAALDRQHPRDLFDMRLYLDQNGIPDAFVDLFLVYLISSNRPVAELLAPRPQPLQPVFDQQFKGMTIDPVEAEELEEFRGRFFKRVPAALRDTHRDFLLSFKAGNPDWSLLRFPEARDLPGVQWKLQNIRALPADRRERFLMKLREVLANDTE